VSRSIDGGGRFSADATRRLARDPLGTVTRALDGAGTAVLPLGARRLHLLAAPEAIREALVRRAGDLVKQNIVDRRASADGKPARLMTSSDPERHLEGRRRYQPFFSSRSVAAFDELVREEAAAVVAGWRTRATAAVGPDLARFATRVAFRALFEHEPGSNDASAEDVAAVMGSFRLVLTRRPKLAAVANLREGVRFARSLERLEQKLGGLLETPLGLATADERLDRAERVAELRGIFVAAVDTTASALSWSLDTISRDPSLAEAAAHDPEAVFAETLRLYPPAWYVGRLAVRDTEAGGSAVAAGDLVWALPYAVQRDRGLWPEPERFDPQRFAGGANRGASGFLPFGLGARRCLGEQLAWLMGRELIGQAVAALRLTPTQAPPRPVASATLRPERPVVLAVESR
jgi:pentalenene oxygenase